MSRGLKKYQIFQFDLECFQECKADMSDSYRLACQCKHNTMGISCQECKPLYNQRKWMHAERNHDNECKMCNCHNHADRCYYDEVVERKVNYIIYYKITAH